MIFGIVFIFFLSFLIQGVAIATPLEDAYSGVPHSIRPAMMEEDFPVLIQPSAPTEDESLVEVSSGESMGRHNKNRQKGDAKKSEHSPAQKIHEEGKGFEEITTLEKPKRAQVNHPLAKDVLAPSYVEEQQYEEMLHIAHEGKHPTQEWNESSNNMQHDLFHS